MTVKECYDAIGGNYEDAISRLRTDERVARFLGKVADDGSFKLLEESLRVRNIEEAFRAAHTLKGVCMNLSLTTLGRSAEALTEALRGRTQFSDDMMPLLENVRRDYETTISAIRALTA